MCKSEVRTLYLLWQLLAFIVIYKSQQQIIFLTNSLCVFVQDMYPCALLSAPQLQCNAVRWISRINFAFPNYYRRHSSLRFARSTIGCQSTINSHIFLVFGRNRPTTRPPSAIAHIELFDSWLLWDFTFASSFISPEMRQITCNLCVSISHMCVVCCPCFHHFDTSLCVRINLNCIIYGSIFWKRILINSCFGTSAVEIETN